MKIVGWTMRGFVFALLSIFVLSACGSDDNGGGGGTDPLPTGVAARIEIAPSAVLLTEPGQTKTLTARVFDADGVEIKSDIQWESTHPEQVSVDAAGVLKASGAGGSSQITAHIGTVESLPLLAVHTKLPAEAVLLTDANIVGEPKETTPGAAAAIGNTYTVQLIDVEKPAVGALLINTEGKIVAGRVTEVTSANGQHNLTLALVPAREMFPALDINEVFELNKAEVVIPEALLEAYDVQKDGDTYTFTPKPTGGLSQLNGQVRQQALEQEFKLGPFDCKLIGDGVAGGGSQNVALTVQPSFSFTLSPSMDVLYTQANGLERFVLHAEPNFTVDGGLKVLVGMEAKVTCDVELAVIKLPVGGPIALLISGLMPIGVGMELGGKLTVADMGISAKAQAKTTLDLGLACPDGAECSVVHDVGDLDVSFEPSVDGPSVADVRVEPSLSTYSFVKIAIGNPFLASLRFNAFVVKSGAALKGSFAPQLTQVADTSYKSDYKLIAELKAGVDTGFKGLAAFMGLNSVAETVAEINTELGTSPTGELTADAAEFVAGDTVNFTVKMDSSKVGFLPLIGPYNVQRILLLRVEPPSTTPKEVASVIAMSDQTEFTIPFEATTPGKADEFYAFVVTTLLPVDLFSLELGRASAVMSGLHGSVSLQSQLISRQTRPGSTQERVTSFQLNGPVFYDPTLGLVLLNAAFTASEVFTSNSVTEIDRTPCIFDSLGETVEQKSIVAEVSGVASVGFILSGDDWTLSRPEVSVTTQVTTTTTNSTANVRGDCTGFDLATRTMTNQQPPRSDSFDPDLSIMRDPAFAGTLIRDAQGRRSVTFADTLKEEDTGAGFFQSVDTTLQLNLTE